MFKDCKKKEDNFLKCRTDEDREENEQFEQKRGGLAGDGRHFLLKLKLQMAQDKPDRYLGLTIIDQYR